MNAPNFSFDAEDGPRNLPSTAVSGPSSINRNSRQVAVNFDPQNFSSQAEQAPDFRKLFFKYFGIALQYRWLILAICSLALVIGFIVTFTSTPIYQATVTIQINRQAQKVVKFQDERDDAGEDQRFYQTQYDLLKSRSLAEKVASDLNLAAASDFLN